MKKKYFFIYWILLIFISFAVRFYKLSDSPNGLYVDEAAIGYNAYSVLETGKDEFGENFPIVFRSFSDFKAPIYIYLTIPFIWLFGLNVFSVRTLSAIASVATIVLSHFLIKEITDRSKPKFKYLEFVVPLLLAVSPWHIMFGRAAFETNLGLFLLLSAIYLFYLALKRPIVLVASALFFGFAFLSYHSQRLIAPVVLISLLVRHKKIFVGNNYKLPLVLSFVTGFIVLLPTIFIMFTPGFLARASGLNILNSQSHTPAGYISGLSGVLGMVVNNSSFLTLREFLTLYLSYFSPKNLFFSGDPELRVSYPGLSVFFLWQFPLYLIGIYELIKKSKSEIGFWVLTLLLVSPIPAAVTNDPFTTIRSFPLVFPLTVVMSLGFLTVSKKAASHKAVVLLTCLGLLTYSIFKLYSSGYVLNNYYRAKSWNYGFKEVSQNIKKLPNKPIVFDNSRLEPYSELLFFLAFSPDRYQADNFEVENQNYYTSISRNKIKKIGPIETRGINWEKDTNESKYLIGDNLAISNEQIQSNRLTLVNRVFYPDGSVAFTIVETNP